MKETLQTLRDKMQDEYFRLMNTNLGKEWDDLFWKYQKLEESYFALYEYVYGEVPHRNTKENIL